MPVPVAGRARLHTDDETGVKGGGRCRGVGGRELVGLSVECGCWRTSLPPTASHLPRPRSVSTRRACSSLVTKMRHPDTAKRPLHRDISMPNPEPEVHCAGAGRGQLDLVLKRAPWHGWYAPPRAAAVGGGAIGDSPRLLAPASVLDTCGRPSSRFRCACGWPRAAAPGAQDTSSSSSSAPAAIRPMAVRVEARL